MRNAKILATLVVLISLFIVACGGDINENLLKAIEESNLEDVQSFIDKGAELNTKDEFDRTPLMIAAYNGDEEIVSFLLEKGADTGATAKYGQTALQFANEQGNTKIADMLKAAAAGN